jgi:hypothetical protein
MSNDIAREFEQLKADIDERLLTLRKSLNQMSEQPIATNSSVTRNAAPACLKFVQSLPRIVVDSISSDAERVSSAERTMTQLQVTLKDAGIDLDDRFTNFPSRLAQLRADFDARRRK